MVMALSDRLPKMTVQEYLAWETTQEFRYEFIDGEILAMSGASIPHNQLALNLYSTLRAHLHKNCRAFVSDVKVCAIEINAFFYPDLVVTCDWNDLSAKDAIRNPTLIVEVLSPSTSSYDRSQKFKLYQMILSLQEYVLIEPGEFRVECYRRGEGRMWLYYPYGKGDFVTFSSLDLTIGMADLYENILFP